MVPDGDFLLHDGFERTVRERPAHVALVCGAERHTYAELGARANAIAASLAERGVGRGDRVVLFLDNTVEMAASIYAVLHLGAVFVPVNPLTKRDKLARLLASTRASALVTHSSLRGAWGDAMHASPALAGCWVAGASGALEAPCLPLPPPGAAAPPRETATTDQDLAALIHTSGSTGEPKGVMLSHLNMMSSVRSITSYLGLRGDDVIGCVLPLSFNYGLYQLLMATRLGATVVLERSFAFPAKVVETMARERVTVFPGVPTMFAVMLGLSTLRDHDLSALRIVTNAGAGLPEDHLQRVRAMFPQARFFSMYGLTEGTRVTYLPPEQLDIRPTSLGRGMPNVEVWLADEHGNRVPDGGTGELVVRGSNVMRGYWEKPEETALRLRPGPLPGELVLYSGDIFRTDAEGWLYFVSRKDDIIKSRGEKVSPLEVESVICALPAVLEAAVVGVPDPVLGQAVKAFVVLREGASLTEREVIRHCLGHLESFMAPRDVEFVDNLPRTDTGKVKRLALA